MNKKIIAIGKNINVLNLNASIGNIQKAITEKEKVLNKLTADLEMFTRKIKEEQEILDNLTDSRDRALRNMWDPYEGKSGDYSQYWVDKCSDLSKKLADAEKIHYPNIKKYRENINDLAQPIILTQIEIALLSRAILPDSFLKKAKDYFALTSQGQELEKKLKAFINESDKTIASKELQKPKGNEYYTEWSETKIKLNKVAVKVNERWEELIKGLEVTGIDFSEIIPRPSGWLEIYNPQPLAHDFQLETY
ncbi:MAG: hypothetical protein PHV30_10545 [Candidatus Margulisbacteria bacterium]|nr:hypothetical protein [Candidatus Margulisiibacteriota bacterium]